MMFFVDDVSGKIFLCWGKHEQLSELSSWLVEIVRNCGVWHAEEDKELQRITVWKPPGISRTSWSSEFECTQQGVPVYHASEKKVAGSSCLAVNSWPSASNSSNCMRLDSMIERTQVDRHHASQFVWSKACGELAGGSLQMSWCMGTRTVLLSPSNPAWPKATETFGRRIKMEWQEVTAARQAEIHA